jgi:putative lipase involved disintegration of autophagic bodies
MKFKRTFFVFFILCSFVLAIYSCNRTGSTTKSLSKSIDKEARFKGWLRDTLTVLGLQKNDEYYREIKVVSDSLSMDIKNSYKIKIRKNYNGDNKELLYAIDLLRRNDLMPEEEFDLEFVIICYYSVPIVEQLIYEFDSEITTFKVKYNNVITSYKFMKGNLIDKTVIP